MKKLIKAQFNRNRFSDIMSKLQTGFIIFIDILLFTALFMIYRVDQMVNGTLYYFGLIFDWGWAQPYYLLSRLAVVLIIAAIVMISSAQLSISSLKEKE